MPIPALVLVLVLVFCTFPLTAPGAEERESEWILQSGLVAGLNPLVFGVSARGGYSIPLSDNPGILWRTTRVEPGVDILANPSFTDVGARLYVEPIAFFDLRAEAGVRAHYTALGFGLVPRDSYGQELTAASGDKHSTEGATGWFIRLAPRIKAAAGPIIAANTLTAAWYFFDDLEASHLEESVTLRVIAGGEDLVLQNTAQLLYHFHNAPAAFAALGVEYTRAWVPAASRSEQEPLQRAAVMGVYVQELRPRMELQSALFLGGYPTGDPIGRARPYVLGAVTVVTRL